MLPISLSFGLTHKGYNNQIKGRKHKYGYNGKEENPELGLEWMDFDVRNYDVTLGRWMNLDPMADLYVEMSPYNYVANNPLLILKGSLFIMLKMEPFYLKRMM